MIILGENQGKQKSSNSACMEEKEKGDEGSEETWPSMQRTAVATRW
jgi:hypothetical protein